jgi:hypothetical protein
MSDPAIQMGIFLFNVYKGPVVEFLAARFGRINLSRSSADRQREQCV